MIESEANCTVLPVKWKQHMALALPPAHASGCIWIHACSVGEVASIAPLVTRLLEYHHPIHLTVVTKTGMGHAKRVFGESIHISYLPWDLPGRIARLIDHIKPGLFLMTETEFWPGMLNACRKRNIPVIGINTRISDRSFPRYRATKWLWKRWLRPVQLFLAQGEIDARRLSELGIETDRIRPVGNLKYAITPPEVDAGRIRAMVDPSGERPILLAASTHRDEEKQLLSMWPLWREAVPELMLILVPRHPERFDPVAAEIESTGLNFSRWSELGSEAEQHPESIILIDAMGLLQKLYTITDIAFIGGSLVPTGGHNPLEAAICGRGVVTGPHVQNFREIMNEMRAAHAAIVCKDALEVEHAVLRLLQHPDELRQLHAKATLYMNEKSSVLDRVMHALQPWLNQLECD
ncbi:MAG: 3-deoxy-D-manno-octulosonic acid transferase [Mariprofundaceae bacterium]|nr:3-deoxy-D-manno-octulosonic acid transferase [Mariprofundaceae bacterium]